MAFDPSRLYSGLLNTGLQSKDNPLYQVIHSLIDGLSTVSKQTSTIINNPAVTNVTQQLIQGLQGDDSSNEDNFYHPNPGIQDLISNFTQGSVIFVGPSGFLAQDNANFFWDSVNKRLGIGITSPSQSLEVAGGIKAATTGSTGQIQSVTTDVTIGSFAALNAFADSTRFFVASHSSARVVARYGITLGGWAEFSALNNTGISNGLIIGVQPAAPIVFGTNNLERARIDSAGNFGIGLTTITALLHLKAGSATANTAPLKFTSGTLLTTAEAGAIEFLTDDFFATITTGASRKQILLNNSITPFTIGSVPFATTNGRLTEDNTNFFWDATNKRLGIGVASPASFIHVKGSSFPTINIESTGVAGGLLQLTSSTNNWQIYNTNGKLAFDGSTTAGVELMIDSVGNIGIGQSSPTSYLHIKAGTATASTAPLKFTAGTLNTTAEIGAVEFVDNGTDGHLYITRNIAGVLTRTQIV